MANEPVDLYIAAYTDPEAAQEDWQGIRDLAKDDLIEIEGLVLVARGNDGKIDIQETAHDVRKGSVIGAVGGLAVGLIFPPAVLAAGLVGAGVGAGVGGLKAHRSRKEIRAEVEQVLPLGSSGIVALVDDQWVGQVERALSHAERLTKHELDKESTEEVTAAAQRGP